MINNKKGPHPLQSAARVYNRNMLAGTQEYRTSAAFMAHVDATIRRTFRERASLVVKFWCTAVRCPSPVAQEVENGD